MCESSDAAVLVTGETGTGKELVAEAIHEQGRRAKRPFVVIDASTLSHELAESELFGHERGAFTGAEVARVGAFEHADGGTIFLDEIGELPLSLQPKLLRALENKQIRRAGSTAYRSVDVRVIAATHRDLRAAVNDKRFRADLYYRLDVVRVDVPPLRERGDDVRMLAALFWNTYRPEVPPPESLLAQFATLSWPGNVRELRNAVERAALLGWSPTQDADTTTLTYQQAKARAVWEWERTWVERLLATHGANLSRAARAVHMGRSHLRELARRHALHTPVDDDD